VNHESRGIVASALRVSTQQLASPPPLPPVSARRPSKATLAPLDARKPRLSQRLCRETRSGELRCPARGSETKPRFRAATGQDGVRTRRPGLPSHPPQPPDHLPPRSGRALAGNHQSSRRTHHAAGRSSARAHAPSNRTA